MKEVVIKFTPESNMSKIEKDRYYTRAHEWAKPESDGDLLSVGISDYAQHSLGDIVFIDIREKGTTVAEGDSFGTIESVKAAEDLYAPVSGTIAEINESLRDSPESLNKDPYGSWIVKISGYNKDTLGNLMDASAYEEYLKSIG